MKSSQAAAFTVQYSTRITLKTLSKEAPSNKCTAAVQNDTRITYAYYPIHNPQHSTPAPPLYWYDNMGGIFASSLPAPSLLQHLQDVVKAAVRGGPGGAPVVARPLGLGHVIHVPPLIHVGPAV